MTRLLISIILLSTSLAAQGAPDDAQTAPDAVQKNQEFTEEELSKLRAAEEEYKDNPAMTEVITRIKKNYGISDEASAPEAPTPAPPEPAFSGSRSAADDAYRNKDYESAINHYKALAQDGDGEASLILGTMYQRGLGTDPDPATAQAWFRKAAENGNPHGQEIMDLYRLKPMTPDEQQQADQRFAEINQKQNAKNGENRESAAGNARGGFTLNPPNVHTGAASISNETRRGGRPLVKLDKTSSVILSVEKLQPAQHFKTATGPSSGWHPNKYPSTETSHLGKLYRVQDDN